jgi:hypothetical protein
MALVSTAMNLLVSNFIFISSLLMLNNMNAYLGGCVLLSVCFIFETLNRFVVLINTLFVERIKLWCLLVYSS